MNVRLEGLAAMVYAVTHPEVITVCVTKATITPAITHVKVCMTLCSSCMLMVIIPAVTQHCINVGRINVTWYNIMYANTDPTSCAYCDILKYIRVKH